MPKITLLLDLDGVLITTPIWRADEMDTDGYSKFNEHCVANLNTLLSQFDFEIWLSSTRRIVKSLEEFRLIFENRNIINTIHNFLPEYQDCKTRKEEIFRFLQVPKISKFLIIDDDKSLNGLEKEDRKKLVLTQFHKGFDEEKLALAIKKVKSIIGYHKA